MAKLVTLYDHTLYFLNSSLSNAITQREAAQGKVLQNMKHLILRNTDKWKHIRYPFGLAWFIIDHARFYLLHHFAHEVTSILSSIYCSYN